MTLLALEGSGGCLGDKGLAALRCASWLNARLPISDAKAMPPMPVETLCRKCRRVCKCACCKRGFIISSLRQHSVQINHNVGDYRPSSQLLRLHVRRQRPDWISRQLHCFRLRLAIMFEL